MDEDSSSVITMFAVFNETLQDGVITGTTSVTASVSSFELSQTPLTARVKLWDRKLCYLSTYSVEPELRVRVSCLYSWQRGAVSWPGLRIFRASTYVLQARATVLINGQPIVVRSEYTSSFQNVYVRASSFRVDIPLYLMHLAWCTFQPLPVFQDGLCDPAGQAGGQQVRDWWCGVG